MTRRDTLVMEDLGFDPSTMFTEEQIVKMRNMKAEGNLRSHRKCKIGKLLDVSDMPSVYERERKGVICLTKLGDKSLIDIGR